MRKKYFKTYRCEKCNTKYSVHAPLGHEAKLSHDCTDCGGKLVFAGYEAEAVDD